MNKILVAIVAVVALALGLYFFEGTEVHRCPIHGEEMTEGTCSVEQVKLFYRTDGGPRFDLTWFATAQMERFPHSGISLKSDVCWVCPKCRDEFIRDVQKRMTANPPDRENVDNIISTSETREPMEPSEISEQYVVEKLHSVFHASAFTPPHR